MFNILFEAKSVSSEIALWVELPREMHQYQNHTPQSLTHLHKNYVQLPKRSYNYVDDYFVEHFVFSSYHKYEGKLLFNLQK